MNTEEFHPHNETDKLFPDENPSSTAVPDGQDKTSHDIRTTLPQLINLPPCKHASVTDFTDGKATVVITSEKIIEDQTVDAMGALLFALVEEGAIDVTIDCSRVGFYSSAAIGKLITLDKKLKRGREGGAATVHIINIKPAVAEVFHITKLDRLFDVYETDEEADRIPAS